MPAPPLHIAAAFGVDGVSAERLPDAGGSAWRYGDIVLAPAADAVLAAWTSGVFETLRVTGIRVPRPVRSLDGRWVVGGWRAQRFLSGRPALRHAESIEASFALDTALRDVPVPRVLLEPIGATGWADRLSWDAKADPRGRLGDGDAATLWYELAAARRPSSLPGQLIHADLFGHVLFAGSAPPAVVEFAPLVGPPGLAAAIFVIDAVAWGGAEPSIGDLTDIVPEWGQTLRRAALYRLAYTLAHPRVSDSAVEAVAVAVRRLTPLMS